MLVNEFLQAQGLEDIYVVGDIADTTYAGLAQTAVSNGAYVGKTIAHTIKGKSLSPYKPAHAPVHVMPVGRFWGVLHYKGLVITGILPHMARYAVDVFYFWRRLSLRHFLTLYIKGKLK